MEPTACIHPQLMEPTASIHPRRAAAFARGVRCANTVCTSSSRTREQSINDALGIHAMP